jgi:hypothetical protein
VRLIAAPRSRRAFSALLPQLEHSDLDLLITGSRGPSPMLPTFRNDLATTLTRTGRYPTIVIPVTDAQTLAALEVTHNGRRRLRTPLPAQR